MDDDIRAYFEIPKKHAGKEAMDEDKGRQAMLVKRIQELMKIANVATPGP